MDLEVDKIIFKNRLKKQVYLLLDPILYFLIGIIIFKYILNFESLTGYYLVMLIIIPPVLIIHYQYWNVSKDSQLTISNQKLEIKQNGEIKKYGYNEIDKIKLFRHKSQKNGFFIMKSTLLCYYFVRFYFKDGSEYNLTCFMINDINLLLNRLKQFKIGIKDEGPMFLCRK